MKQSVSEITLVTGNEKKMQEIQQIIGDGFRLTWKKIDLTEIQGDAEEIVKDKCRRAANIVRGPVLIEDTSLYFNALKTLPGPYIKWFMELPLEDLYAMLHGFNDKSGYALCLFAFSNGPEDEPLVFAGVTNGTIVHPRGPRDFGWDAVFQPDGYNETFAEMPKEIKNENSHRFRALKKFKNYFE